MATLFCFGTILNPEANLKNSPGPGAEGGWILQVQIYEKSIRDFVRTDVCLLTKLGLE